MATISIGSKTDIATKTVVNTIRRDTNVQRTIGQVSAALGSAEVLHLSRENLGINTAVWDSQLTLPSTITALKTLNVGYEQFPNLDTWNWETGYSRNPDNNWSTWQTWKEPVSLLKWGKLLEQVGSHGCYIVNYGSNAHWTGPDTVANVRRLTDYIVRHHLPITAMVIGSEQYGSWSLDLNSNHSPITYATMVGKMARTIHEIDPEMAVGVDFVIPNPGQNDYSQTMSKWDGTVLKADAAYIQFVSVHDYPVTEPESNTRLLNSLQIIPAQMAGIRALIQKYAPHYAASIKVWVTEMNPYWNQPTPQSTQPIYKAAIIESDLLWEASGASEVFAWTLHAQSTAWSQSGTMGSPNDTTARSLYGTYALVSDGVKPQPSLNSLLPAGQALSSLTSALQNGATVRLWPALLWQQGILLVSISSSERTTWYLINNEPVIQRLPEVISNSLVTSDSSTGSKLHSVSKSELYLPPTSATVIFTPNE